MLDAEEFNVIKEALLSSDVNECLAMLKVLVEDPSGDPRLLSIIESLLVDARACVVQIPIFVGEIRWLAAHALAAERKAAGVMEPVRLTGIARPLDLVQLNAIATQAYGNEALHWPLLQRFERLQEDGKLPTFDLVLT